ncbi:unnamed protein product [Rhizophagus irregularis]|uniref:Uncharacterized protein n=1 Tax=Rhizophagus irregularis TaxID=588596 RepID=A0A915ZZ66_9GLOM|nr:unnamed protein product [Rhizophagus irregularis]
MGKKWELDSLVSFLKLSHNYWSNTKDDRYLTNKFGRNWSSDDSTTFPFLISSSAFASVELSQLYRDD